MKIVKLFFIFAVVSMITFSCKESKKEDAQDDASVEMTDEGSEAGGMDATEEGGEEAASSDAAAEGSMDAAESIEAESKGLEPLVVPEGVIAEELADTPVVYPGCEGSIEEIRACNRESFITFLRNEFDKELAKEANLKSGDYEIRSIVHVDETGKVAALRITAPNKALETEMKRVMAKVPQVVPATEAGEAVGVTFMVPVKFQVEKL